MRTNNMSQSALEYMMTYGWAILIIVIVAGVLYSLGIFNPASSSTSNAVTGFSGLNVQAQCIQGGALQLQIINGLGYTVNITMINTTSSTGQTGATLKAYSLLSPTGSSSYYVANACTSTAGSQYSVQATVTYTEPGRIFSGPYTSSGTISGKSSKVNQTLVAGFNGVNSYANLSNKSILDPTQITEIAWVKPKTQSGSNRVFSKPGSLGSDYDMYITTTSAAGIRSSNSTTTSAYQSGGSKLALNIWQMIAITYNGAGVMTIYVNQTNVQSGYPGILNSLASTTSPLKLGCCNSGANDYFNGSIADIQLYNTVLSGAQISQIYAEGLGGGPIAGAGLIGWWPLNGNLLDFSGNGDTGPGSNILWVGP